MEQPGFFDKLALGFGTGSKIIAKVQVGDHLQLFSLVRGDKPLVDIRHSHGGDIKYYAYAESEARLLATRILELLPPADGPGAEA